jgi:hypothetical protein
LTAVVTESPVGVGVLRDSWMSLEGCQRGAEPYRQLVELWAERCEVELRTLNTRALLQFPRVVDFAGALSLDDVENIVSSCAKRLSDDLKAVGGLAPNVRLPLRDLDFVELDSADAARVFDHLHYLRSARPGSRNFALVHPFHRWPVTLCSVSPLEWALVGRQLERQFGIGMEQARDVSRVYSFEVAPENAISLLLSKVRQVMRRTEPEVELLTTAVDPNLGFTGSSYRAANWEHWISVRPRPYLYCNGLYVTPRQLRSEYGTANLTDVRLLSGRLVETSRVKLRNSMIFCSRTTGPTECVESSELRLLRR